MGLIAGMGQVIVFIIHLVILWLSNLAFPESSIDIAEDFPSMTYMQNPEKYGEHIYNVNEVDPSLDEEKKKPHLVRGKPFNRFNLDKRNNSDVDLINSSSNALISTRNKQASN